MFGQDTGKPVTVMVIEDTYINGNPVSRGTLLRDLPAEVALELAAGGKVRAPSAADLKKDKAP